MPGAAFSRKPRFGIATKLAVCLVGAAVLGFALFSFIHQRLEQRHLETLVSVSAERVADVVHSSAYDAMLKNDRERLYTLIRDFGREPGIRRVRIINEDGLVRHSTQPGEAGTMVDKSAEACYACHVQAQPITKLARKERARIFTDVDGTRTLAVIRPIENHPECSNAACHAHPASRRILGVIDAHLALDNVDLQLAEHRKQIGLFSLASAIVACLLSVAFVWLVLHRPLKELTRGTQMLARGELDHRIRVHSDDELGDLARSFNGMAEEIDRSHQELREWADTLEHRVLKKTEDLEKAHRGLLVSEKMASLGRLAATVAHEVNNPLFGMLTYARLTIKDLNNLQDANGLKDRMRGHLEIIERESKRCGELMKNLLAFSRQRPPQLSPAQVNGLVESSVRLVWHKLELNQIALEQDLAEDLPEVICDPSQIQQVLIVLIVNAAEALGKGGVIRVKTARRADGNGIEITVTDNGPGIPPAIQENIFEPFFTTKENEHRTGLGLAVAKGIIDRHAGTLVLESAPGKGAKFTIGLPMQAPAAVAETLQGDHA